MEETAIEKYGRKLAHVVNMYWREVKPKGWHVDKELTPEDGEALLKKMEKPSHRVHGDTEAQITNND